MKMKLKNTPEQVELIKAMGSKSPEISRPATEAGGLPSSQVSGNAELKIATYKLDSAVSFLKKYARKSRLDVVSKGIERMANEILVRQDRNAWAVILKGLAEAKGKWGTGSAGDNVIDSSTGAFGLADINAMMTKMKRINASYADGTPSAAYSKGLTDVFTSAEVVEDIRAISYNPFSTTAEQVGDIVKDEMYKAAGANSIFGINIVDLYEFGLGQKYNTLYTAMGGTLTGDQQIIVGVDRSAEAFVRPVARNSETGSTFTALPDDQFVQRQDKTGFYGGLEEGRVLLDARAIVGLRKQIPA